MMTFIVLAQQHASQTSTLNYDIAAGKRTRRQKSRLLQSKKYNRDKIMRRSWSLGDHSSPTGKAGKDGKSSSKSGKSTSDQTSPSWPSWPSWSSSSTSPNCSDQSAEPTTENPSQIPTIPPSILLSTSPTITTLPTTSPVQTPSNVPTITVSSLPSTMPSISPTARPSIDGTSIPSTIPSISPSTTPTNTESIVPTLQASSPKPSVSQSISPTGLKDSSPTPTTTSGATPIPTYSPTNSSEPVESNAPTPSNIIGTASPTAELINDTMQGLKMSLFGLPNTLLDTSQQQYYQLRTATYIEEFYNNDDGTNGILEAIKSEIANVTAILTIESQEYEDDGGVTDGIRMVPINDEDEGYLPEFAASNSKSRHNNFSSSSSSSSIIINNNNRLLQASTQVTEPCIGTSSLKITFSLELSYQKTEMNEEVDSNTIVLFPFSAVDFRTNYIDNYLKNPQSEANEGNVVDASAVFDDVYCTSRVVERMDSPTYFPSKSSPSITSSPSLLSSVPPSSGEPATQIPSLQSASSVPSTQLPITSSPSSLTSVPPSSGEPVSLIPSPQSASITPSTKLPTTSVSFSPSSISSGSPTVGSGGSSVPTNSTRPPTNDGSLGPTTIPPSSALPVGSTRPSIISKPNVTSNPSDLDGSSAPSFGQVTSSGPTTQPPTTVAAPISAVPSAVFPGPSRSPSGNETSSSAPSTSSVSSLVPSTDDIFVDNINSSTSPSTTELKSAKPSTDDIFVDLRMINKGTNERKCQGEDIREMNDKMEEFELSFVYGVESSSQDVYEFTDDLENLVLDFVASTVLICASDSDVITVHRSQQMEKEFRDLGVIRVRYPEYGEITSIADCDPLLSSRAESCAILNTKLLVTSAGAPISEVHHDILTVLMKAFNENKFGELIPNLTTTSYLGPDPESSTLSFSPLATGKLDIGGTSRTSAIAVSIGCSLLILIVALCAGFRRSSKVANTKHSSRFSRRQHKRLATQEEEEEENEEEEGLRDQSTR